MENKQDEIKNIELRSQEVSDILGTPPKWIVRSGISVLFSVIMVLIVGSFFFKYPDVVNAELSITTEHVPARVQARTGGRIEKLFFQEQEQVNKGQIIGYIENTSDYEEIQDLSSMISHIEFIELNKLRRLGKLGELQQIYNQFLDNKEKLSLFLSLNYYPVKISDAETEIKQQKAYKAQIEKQVNLSRESLHIGTRQFQRDSLLHHQAFIAEADYDKSREQLLRSSSSFEQLLASVKQIDISISRLEAQKRELELKYKEEQFVLNKNIQQSQKELVNQLKAWQKQYLLVAPVSGTISYTKYWNANQLLQAGESIGTIIPEEAGNKIVKAKLPMQSAGKVRKGQRVNMKLHNFPYMEFGMLKGEVQSISLVPDEDNYILEISLSNGLKSMYGRELSFSQEMKGTAEIVTDDLSLFERFLAPVKHVLSKQVN